MSGFLGKYEYQMDEKGRVSLPSVFRQGPEADRFILLQWEKPYLTLFTSPVWEEVQQRLLEFRKREPSAWHHVREIVANAADVAPDKQGRILVPSSLKEAASLDRAVLLNGNIDRIELWNPELYRSTVQAAAPAADVQRFAHQVFG
jgi:MraZ protein